MDFILNAVALVTSISAIYLTTCKEEAWIRRGGCCVGIVSCIFNIYLLRYGPWSALVLNVIALGLYARGANLPELVKKLSDKKTAAPTSAWKKKS